MENGYLLSTLNSLYQHYVEVVHLNNLVGQSEPENKPHNFRNPEPRRKSQRKSVPSSALTRYATRSLRSSTRFGNPTQKLINIETADGPSTSRLDDDETDDEDSRRQAPPPKVRKVTSNENVPDAAFQVVFKSRDGFTADELGIKIKKRVRRCWVKEENSCSNRQGSGYFHVTFLKLKEENPDEFFELVRMEVGHYERLLEMVEDDLKRNSVRKAIEPECRLAATLIHLAQGTPFFQLAKTFRIGYSTVRHIVYQTCQTLWDILCPDYVHNQLNYNISKEFDNVLSLPKCIGVMSAKSLSFLRPRKCLKLEPITFMIVCDANGYIIWTDVSTQPVTATKNLFDHPPEPDPLNECLPGSDVKFPYYYVVDGSFPLKEHVMRPYASNEFENEVKTHFNKQLESAQRVADNTFGVLTTRWRVLQSAFKCVPEKCPLMVLAIVALHNFIKFNTVDGQGKYCPPGYEDWEDENGRLHLGSWRREIETPLSEPDVKFESDDDSTLASQNRDILADYLFMRTHSN